MAITRRTIRLLGGLRIRVNGMVDGVGNDLVSRWASAWDELAKEWEVALASLIAATDGGGWPTPAQIRRADRVWRAMDATRDALVELSEYLEIRVLQDLPALTGEAAEWQARIIASQLPPAAGDQAALVTQFNRVDALQLEQIVTRTTGQITAASRPLSAEATAVMQNQLIRGVAVGDNPRTVAATMLRRMEGGFNGGLTRALVISRTEMLDAYRNAAHLQDQSNVDVLTGWQWLATLDTRTCPSCLTQHGSLHPVEEEGPFDHQQGRCARLPVVKPWTDLGFKGLDEPASAVPDARAWFDDLSAADQLQVMGPERLRLLQDGAIGWDDLSRRRDNRGWRPSYNTIPVKDLAS